MTTTNSRAEAPISHIGRNHSSAAGCGRGSGLSDSGGSNSSLRCFSASTLCCPPAAFTPPSHTPPNFRVMPGPEAWRTRRGKPMHHVTRNAPGRDVLSRPLLPPGEHTVSVEVILLLQSAPFPLHRTEKQNVFLTHSNFCHL